MFFVHDIFTSQVCTDTLTATVLQRAVEYAEQQVCPADVLRALLQSNEQSFLSLFTQALDPETSIDDVLQILTIYHPARPVPDVTPKGKQAFSAGLLAALTEFEAEWPQYAVSTQAKPLLLLALCMLNHLETTDFEYLSILNVPQCLALLRQPLQIAQPVSSGLAISKTFSSAQFSKQAWECLQSATVYASRSAAASIMPEHCFLALLDEKDGITRRILRSQLSPETTPEDCAHALRESLLTLKKRSVIPLTFDTEHLHAETLKLLEMAQQATHLWQHEVTDTLHLLYGLLETMSARLVALFRASCDSIDLSKMRRHLQYHIQDVQTATWSESPFMLPADILPSEDLTYQARIQQLPPAIAVGANGQLKAENGRYAREELLQALHRRKNNHILITGERGVGKTALLKELARRATSGEIPFLKQRRFVRIDCADLSPQESHKKLLHLLAAVAGQKHLMLCLDGLGAFLRSKAKEENILLLRRVLREQQVQCIGILSSREFEELLSSEYEFLEFFTRVHVTEPDEEATLAILKQLSTQFAQDYQVQIDERMLERAMMLSSNYMLNEHQPAKAVKVLRLACEQLDYERSAFGATRITLSVEDIIHVVAQLTGLPEETLTGMTKKANYEQDLVEFVIGQDEAVKVVARELRRIKAGWADASKPASVLLFAGLTGVGKTELAKALAQFYSSSKRLQTYTMANFTEPHSVSGIIGVPPGYVGYDQGGRLINDLNADPYCVFLLDEAEKAHPEVWKPFLNLFDEAWITDTRGIKAYADKAIFILTTNAGAESIAQMWLEGERDMQRVAEQVKLALGNVQHERSNQPVFSPEFLARIRHIIIFRPLDLSAMENICRKHVKKMQQVWRQKREKTLMIPEVLVKYIAERSHRLNQRSGNKEGGRIVERLLSQLVEDTIQQKQIEAEEEYKQADTIEVHCTLPPDAPDIYDYLPAIRIVFRQQKCNEYGE